jgi:hypothetical protein
MDERDNCFALGGDEAMRGVAGEVMGDSFLGTGCLFGLETPGRWRDLVSVNDGPTSTESSAVPARRSKSSRRRFNFLPTTTKAVN